MLQLINALDRFYEASHHLSKVKIVSPIQAKLKRALDKAFTLQGKAFVKGLVKFKSEFPPEVKESSPLHPLLRAVGSRHLKEVLVFDDLAPVFDASDADSLQAFLLPLEDAVAKALKAAAMQQIAELGYSLSFKLSNPRAVAYIKAHGADLIAKINAETRAQIKTLITQAIEEGWSYQETARAIIAKYDGMAIAVPGNYTSRAERIAVTEAGNAYEAGNWIPIQDLMEGGISMEKSWDTAPELSKTGPCPEICQPNADQGWIPADEPFGSGDDHPLGHVGCYCDCLYQAKGA
jgi:hypothetical protein